VVIEGFEKRADAAHAPVTLDASQRAVLALPDDASAAVLGAPGTGKTTTTVELVADRVARRGWSPDEMLVLTIGRAAATRLRDRLALRVAAEAARAEASGAAAASAEVSGAEASGAATSGAATHGPLARTINSLAFEAVTNAATLAGHPRPRLVTGGEQDADIAELLAGETELGIDRWPAELGPDVRALRSFRSELRELMSRCVEFGVDADRLRALGHTTGRPEWVAAAGFIEDYDRAVTASRPDQFTSAEIAAFAASAIDRGEAGARIDSVRLVIVDDLHEAPESALAVLRALARRGTAVIGLGDPDVATNSFRGGEADALARLGTVLGAPVTTLRLDRVHRGGAGIRSLVSRVTQRIGTAGGGTQRAAVAGEAADSIAVLSAPSVAREHAAIARQLREAHLDRRVPWSEMLVVVRSGAAVPAVRRALALAEVPTRVAVGAAPLREDRAARALLAVVDVGIGRTELTGSLAAELLTGPFGGLDRLALRRLRLALRTEELAGGGTRAADELLVEALADPARLATIDHRVGRRAARLAGILQRLGEAGARGDTIEELLWLAWERSGLADAWRDLALGSGIAATEADTNLDGVLAVFSAARRFVERRPGASASSFLFAVLEAEVPEDTLAPQPSGDSVLVTTPPGAAGLEVDTVVVAGLQEGVWPNLRLRGSLLAPQHLVRTVTATDSPAIDERRLVLDDELRMFALAVSRARSRVVLSAVENEDEAASVLLNFAPQGAERIQASALPPMTLRGMVGRLRRELAAPEAGRTARADAASGLAQLAVESVPGADPSSWHGLAAISTDAPLYLDEESVPVSPSQLGRFEESPLDWFVDLVSGSQSSVTLGIGTIMHWAMETAAEPGLDALLALVEQRWSELVFESPWLAESSRRAARVFASGISEYLTDFARDGKTLVGAESRFELEVDRARVRGSIDRVERNAEGEVVIVDLKTGTPVAAAGIPEHPQLGAYQLAYASGVLDELLAELDAHRAGGAKLLWVKEGARGKAYKESVQQAFDEQQLESFRTRVRLAALGMAAAEFAGVLEVPARGGPPGWQGLIHRVGTVSG
jgi:superfamily I DNA/RNA helicase/RecB family exonuclease